MKDTIKIVQKNSYSCQISFEDQRDLTGYLFNFIVKNKNDCLNNDNNALINKNETLSGVDAQNGIFYLTLTSNDTNIKANDYIAQIQLSKNDYVFSKQLNFIITNNLKKD